MRRGKFFTHFVTFGKKCSYVLESFFLKLKDLETNHKIGLSFIWPMSHRSVLPSLSLSLLYTHWHTYVHTHTHTYTLRSKNRDASKNTLHGNILSVREGVRVVDPSERGVRAYCSSLLSVHHLFAWQSAKHFCPLLSLIVTPTHFHRHISLRLSNNSFFPFFFISTFAQDFYVCLTSIGLLPCCFFLFL